MALLFADSFDHYSIPADKWSSGNGGAPNDLTGTQSRTGIGAGVIAGVLAPSLNFGGGAGPFYAGVAYSPASLSGAPINFVVAGNIACGLLVNGDGTVSIYNSGGFISAKSAVVAQQGVYNYMELSCQIVGASIIASARVNGFPVLGPVTFTAGGQIEVTTLSPHGPGGGNLAYIDDLYLCDGTGPHNNGFLGAVRIYSGEPVSDSAPLQWTPSTGTAHWSLVNTVPPTGATFVADNVVSDQDQYIHATGSPPAGDVILAVTHNLDFNLAAAGSRKVSSCINGTPHGAGFPLTTAYHIYQTPYDVNPSSGITWNVNDFATLPIGPEVTA